MPSLDITYFDQFFSELHSGAKPFPWQRKLAERVLTSGWPAVIDLPTASGKTACIDIALYALACSSALPRRIFFVVDRRVVVNEASNRMKLIAKALRETQGGVTAEVAQRFKDMCRDPDADPLATYELRGGMYRDESWVRNALQPAVITSTVDQVGSRLLFRGYGLSDGVLPIHASLIANDALIILDEAHCSNAFADTLARIKEYRSEKWAQEALRMPFVSVEMTATPSRSPQFEPFRLSVEDEAPENLGQRLRARKPANLVLVKASVNDWTKFANAIVEQALDVATAARAQRIAVIVNRIVTARLIWHTLSNAGKNADLVIGRMRPIDRDDLNEKLKPLKAGEPRSDCGEPWFIVATQCLEAGADLDFDALVTECASMDAVLQRFGRLDRLGSFGHAVARIVAATSQVDGKRSDPVYGRSLSATWQWLSGLAASGHQLNFGIQSSENEPETVPRLWKMSVPEQRKAMTMDLPSAPILLPAHLDALVQTSPKPAAEPEVGLFLHGPERASRDIQVVWRAELDGVSPDQWADVIALSPPVSAEAMPVPIWEFQRWVAGRMPASVAADIEGVAIDIPDEDEAAAEPKSFLIWRGDKSTNDIHKLRPGDTVVVRAREGGGRELGHTLVEDGVALDMGDRAFFESRKKIRLRLSSALADIWPEGNSKKEVFAVAARGDFFWEDFQVAVSTYLENADLAQYKWLTTALHEILSKRERAFKVSRNPEVVVESRYRVGKTDAIEDDGQGDEMSTGAEVSLTRHLEDVRAELVRVSHLVTQPIAWAVDVAARWHDCGKADLRFQTRLRNGDELTARFAPQLLAKGHFATNRLRNAQHEGLLPKGFRHELVSLALVQGTNFAEERDLVLHLIASHHGHCRPFAPVVTDNAAESLSFEEFTISAEDRLHRAAHHLDSGVPDRFWGLTRRFGWWGLAYLETLLRLSDWNASAKEIQENTTAQ